MQATSALLMLVESHGSCEQSATSTALNHPYYLSPLLHMLWGLQLTFYCGSQEKGPKTTPYGPVQGPAGRAENSL